MKKTLFLGIALFALLALSMCIGEERPTNETELEKNEGIGIVKNLRTVDLYFGKTGFLALSVKANLDGGYAKNVEACLSNVYPFIVSQQCKTKDAMAPGEKYTFFWSVRAPSEKDVGGLTLEHAFYVKLSYEYETSTYQEAIFMSTDEYMKRMETNMPIEEAKSASSAGELVVKGVSNLPIVYNKGEEMNTSLILKLENNGRGWPGNTCVIIVAPKTEGINVLGGDWSTDVESKLGEYDLSWSLQGKSISGTPYIKCIEQKDFYSPYMLYFPITIESNKDYIKTVFRIFVVYQYIFEERQVIKVYREKL